MVFNMMRKAPLPILVVIFLIPPGVIQAQGDGPRSQLLLPVGVNVLVPTYLNLSGNYNFAESILVQDADITSDVFVLTYTRAFSLAGRKGGVFTDIEKGKTAGIRRSRSRCGAIRFIPAGNHEQPEKGGKKPPG